MDDKLPPEYFELIQETLNEQKRKGRDDENRPLKRHRKRGDNGAQLQEPEPVSFSEVIEIDHTSPDELEVINIDESEVSNKSDDDEDYNSDEFEDVIEENTSTREDINDISVTIESGSKSQKELGRKRQLVRNICSSEERKRRYEMHIIILLSFMVHGFMRNKWLNDEKLLKRLSRLVPENVFNLLHPAKDEELPLRSTRKLLDGLKQCLEIWEKHWKITSRYESIGCYMSKWNELSDVTIPKIVPTIDKHGFLRQVCKGRGTRDIAAQGFVALLRSCNLNARLIMSCQPPDFTDLKLKDTTHNTNSRDTFKYPIFWCEVWDKFSKDWITVDAINFKLIEQVRSHSKLEPRGVQCCKRNCIRYVIGYDRKFGARDITRRYSYWFNAKTRKRRITKDGDGQKLLDTVLAALHQRKRTKIDDYEDAYLEERTANEPMPDNVQDLKNHPFYILETDIRKNQVIRKGCKECGYLKLHGRVGKVLKVFKKQNLMTLRTARQWYNEGRILKTGCLSIKKITKSNKRKLPDDEPAEERLYRFEDTEIYIPPMADSDGKIKTNTFGNIEIFVPSMIPANCCLIENPIAIKAARLLQIEFAPAVTGFKFERGNASKPIISGVVVAAWFREAVEVAIDGIESSIEDDRQKEIELQSLEHWRNLLLKLRIKDELNATYGKVLEDESGSKEEEEEEIPAGGFLISHREEVIQPSFDDRHSDDTNNGDVSLRNVENASSSAESTQEHSGEYDAFLEELGTFEDD